MKRAVWKRRVRDFWQETGKPLVVILLVTSALRSALADWNDVPTGSMKPTILEGDRVWVNKLAYDLKVPFTTRRLAQWGDPQRGEIVVFFSPADGKRLVKRVVGLPGDTVAMVNNRLLINGQPVSYEPLADGVINEIPADEQPFHRFAQEHLAGHRHAVMATPQTAAIRSFGPVTVPSGHYFMMGDNRDESFDSRYFGCVERKRIVGQATAVALSLDRKNFYLPRWHRFFSALR